MTRVNCTLIDAQQFTTAEKKNYDWIAQSGRQVGQTTLLLGKAMLFMGNSAESEDFDLQDPIGPSSNITHGGEIELWEPIKLGRSFDIEKSDSPKSSDVNVGGNVQDWVLLSEVLIKLRFEETRSRLLQSTEWTRIGLVCLSMLFFTVWFIVGLYVFFHSGYIWFLVSEGILAVPLAAIFNHYFRRPGG